MLTFLIELKDRTVISQGNHMSEAYSHNSHTVLNPRDTQRVSQEGEKALKN